MQNLLLRGDISGINAAYMRVEARHQGSQARLAAQTQQVCYQEQEA
jgi:hypothetical protein